jgi:Tfp pilus assembly protein PilO
MKTKMIEQFADSPKRVRIMFRVALVILLAAGCYNWVVQPQVSYLSAAQQRSRWDAKISDQQKQILSSIGELNKRITDMKSRSEEFQKVLFEPGTVRQFFCGLETQAKEAGCQIESLTFNDTESSSNQQQNPDAMVQAVPASLVVIGNYNVLARFLEQVSRCPQKISINEMRLEPQVQGKSVLRGHITMTVYVSKKTMAKNP